MPPKHRKVPFSGKKKKQQLQQKNARKQEKAANMDPSSFDYLGKTKPLKANLLNHFVKGTEGVLKNSSDLDTKTKLVSVFDKLTPQSIEQEKLASMQPLNRLPKESLELKESDFSEYIEFPKRPFWDYDMSKEEVEQHETESFQNWLKDIQEKYAGKQISWFERNLEVWRQLWRVLEISDVILIIMDIRNPLLHFPISLYNFIIHEKKKSIVGVFNKVDLVSEFTVFAWKKYFEETFPNLHIATFSCFPRDKNLIDDTVTYALKNQAKRPRKRYYHAQGVKNILSVCRDVLDKPNVPVNWDSIISRYDEDSEHEEEEEEDSDDSDTESINGLDDEFSGILKVTSRAVHPHKDYITLGLVGHPNVGKSSLINSIMRKTVVSASRTPGHTKHFQTIYIADNVRLCDSPGLVFPALIPRALQIISGMYPIAQVQEPYSAIRYLAERIPLEKILSLTPPDFSRDYQWSAWTICEAFAEQRGFHTAKTAQPDVYRAANAILRLTADGRILLSFKPPGFFTSNKYEILRVTEADSNRDNSDDEDKKEEGPVVITKGGFSALASDSE